MASDTPGGGPSLPDEDDRADWDADDRGVLGAGFHYDDDRQSFEYRFEDVDLDIHADIDHGICLIAQEDSEQWRDVQIRIDADTADDVAEQLELAAEKLREPQGADVRI